MTGTKWKLATALGVAGAIALSVPSAEARGGRNAAIGFGIAAGALALGAAAAASQPRYYYEWLLWRRTICLSAELRVRAAVRL